MVQKMLSTVSVHHVRKLVQTVDFHEITEMQLLQYRHPKMGKAIEQVWRDCQARKNIKIPKRNPAQKCRASR